MHAQFVKKQIVLMIILMLVITMILPLDLIEAILLDLHSKDTILPLLLTPKIIQDLEMYNFRENFPELTCHP